jgi:hypothetical protein
VFQAVFVVRCAVLHPPNLLYGADQPSHRWITISDDGSTTAVYFSDYLTATGAC